MRTRIVTFLVIIVMVFLFFDKNVGCNQLSPAYSGNSQSIDESKDKGAFLYELSASPASLILESGDTIKITHAWLENMWTVQVYLFLKTTITKHDSYQMIIVYKIAESERPKAPKEFYFLGARRKGDSLTCYYCPKGDTINVPLYRESSAFLPASDKRVTHDSIVFVRRPEYLYKRDGE